MKQILDCGHRPTPTHGCGTGIAVRGDETLCYSCSDTAQKKEYENLAYGEKMVLYLSMDPTDVGSRIRHNLTTWSGGIIASVFVWESRISPTCYGLRFQSVDGRYYGTSPGAGMYAIVRRKKNS